MLQHFVKENKDRSIFRKNIGRALLHNTNDPYLIEWERDRTSRAARELFGAEPDLAKRRAVEAGVSDYLRAHFSFVVFNVDDASTPLLLESKLISTVSQCADCKPSSGWLGLNSPKDKIRASGLWLVNELGGKPLSAQELEDLRAMLT
jgi:hypothetical protein